MTEYPQSLKIMRELSQYTICKKRKKIMKIEQQKSVREAPPNPIYSVFSFLTC